MLLIAVAPRIPSHVAVRWTLSTAKVAAKYGYRRTQPYHKMSRTESHNLALLDISSRNRAL
jgi:hypothetical protein